MRQTAFIVATLTGSLLFGATFAGAWQAPLFAGAGGGTPAAQAADDGAPPAGALAAAIGDQFPGHAVEVALGAPTLVDAGPAQREVQALARVRIDGSAPMLVRANALYDRDAASLSAPSLWFEGGGSIPADDAARAALARAAEARLGAEFAGQPVVLSLGDADAVALGGRYLRLVARGVADFGAEGRAATTIEALYDPRNGEWLRLDYTLGADPAEGDADADIAYATP